MSLRRGTIASLLALSCAPACEIRSPRAPITVYSSALAASFPLPQGWAPDAATEQAGFQMQTFTGRSVDVPERPGIRVQVMAGPTPQGSLDDIALRYRQGLTVEREGAFSLAGHEGKSWVFVSEDGEERSRLALADVSGMLYGIFVRGEAPTFEAHEQALDRLFREFSIEKAKYFAVFEAPGGDVLLKHPEKWERTQTTSDPGRSLFVGFRSPPLAVEGDGTTVHATLEVTVNQVPPELTVERFYADRTEQLRDTYRLLEHQAIEEASAISTLYQVETQLADYLERTVYAVREGKSFIFKFNARPQVYHAIEAWIDEIVESNLRPFAGEVPS